MDQPYDNFDDLPSASEEISEGVRKILEERRARMDRLVEELGLPVLDIKLSEVDPQDMLGVPMLPPSNPWAGMTNEQIDAAMERVIFRSDGYKPGGFTLGGAPGIGKTYTFEAREEVKSFRIRGLELLDPDKGKPEWQKRRDASARSKARLVRKLKGGHRAR